MQRIKEVKARKEFLEDLGTAGLVIFTYIMTGFATGVGIVFGLEIFLF